MFSSVIVLTFFVIRRIFCLMKDKKLFCGIEKIKWGFRLIYPNRAPNPSSAASSLAFSSSAFFFLSSAGAAAAFCSVGAAAAGAAAIMAGAALSASSMLTSLREATSALTFTWSTDMPAAVRTALTDSSVICLPAL